MGGGNSTRRCEARARVGRNARSPRRRRARHGKACRRSSSSMRSNACSPTPHRRRVTPLGRNGWRRFSRSYARGSTRRCRACRRRVSPERHCTTSTGSGRSWSACSRTAASRSTRTSSRTRSVPSCSAARPGSLRTRWARARASANLYSLVETAKANGIEPWAYLRHLFERLPAATEPADAEALLPHRVDRGALARP